MIAYLDSSAIAKLYLDDEVGMDTLREIVTGSTLVTSMLSYVEVRASLAAAHRLFEMENRLGRSARKASNAL